MINNLIRSICVLMGLFLLSVTSPAYGQREYKGNHAEFFHKKALAGLRNFYSLTLEVSLEDELASLFQMNVNENFLTPDCYLKPDFVSGYRDIGVYTFTHYLSVFSNTYNRYFNLADTDTEGLVFRITDDRPVFIRWTDDSKGVLVGIEFNLTLSSMGRTLYRGTSQGVVEFDDILNLTDYRIKQIVPIHPASGNQIPDETVQKDVSVPGAVDYEKLKEKYIAQSIKEGTSLEDMVNDEEFPPVKLMRRLTVDDSTAVFYVSETTSLGTSFIVTSLQKQDSDLVLHNVKTFDGPCLYTYSPADSTVVGFTMTGHFHKKEGYCDSLIINYSNGITLYSAKTGRNNEYVVVSPDGKARRFVSDAPLSSLHKCVGEMENAYGNTLKGYFINFKPANGYFYQETLEDSTVVTGPVNNQMVSPYGFREVWSSDGLSVTVDLGFRSGGTFVFDKAGCAVNFTLVPGKSPFFPIFELKDSRFDGKVVFYKSGLSRMPHQVLFRNLRPGTGIKVSSFYDIYKGEWTGDTQMVLGNDTGTVQHRRLVFSR